MPTPSSIARIIQDLAASQAQIAMRRGDVNAGMIQGLAGIPSGIIGMKQDLEDRDLRRSSLQRAGEMQGIQIDRARREEQDEKELRTILASIPGGLEAVGARLQAMLQFYDTRDPSKAAEIRADLQGEAIDKFKAMEGQPGKMTPDPVTGIPTELEGHAPINVPGKYGGGFQLQPRTDSELMRKVLALKRAESQIKREENTYEIDGQGLPSQAIAPTISAKAAGERQEKSLTATAEQKEKDRQTQLEAARIRRAGVRDPNQPTPYQIKRLEVDLRKEFNASPIVKEYDDVRKQMARVESAIEQAKTSKNFVAIDQALINGLNKMIDPQSVVREGEYARTIQNSPMLSRVAGKIDQIRTGGGGFTADERNALVSMMRDFYRDAEDLYFTHASEYERLAEGGGIDKSRVVIKRDKIAPKSADKDKPKSDPLGLFK